MTETTGRNRAPAMTPERRRAMIVDAALPLVTERGAAVTTAQIARAAGIGEGTIFRVFRDKDDVLRACVAESLRPDRVLDEIASIPLDQPLASRLVAAAEALDAHLARIGAVVGSLHHRPPPGEPDARPQEHRDSLRELRAAIAELFAPERDALRGNADDLAGLLLGQLLIRSDPRLPGRAGPEVSVLVDVFLHGALLSRGAQGTPVTIDHVALPARDAGVAARFLADLLGIAETAPEGPDGDMVSVPLGAGAMVLYVDAPDATPTPQHVALRVGVDHFGRVVDALAEHAVAFGNDPEHPDNGQTTDVLGGPGRIYFTDRGGHLLEVVAQG